MGIKFWEGGVVHQMDPSQKQVDWLAGQQIRGLTKLRNETEIELIKLKGLIKKLEDDLCEDMQNIRNDCVACLDAEKLAEDINICKNQQAALIDMVSAVFVKLFNKKEKARGKTRRSANK